MKKTFIWNEIFRMADGKGEYELQAKENARNQIGQYIADNYGYDIEQCYCPEEEIDGFLDEHKDIDRFDVDGNLEALYTNEVADDD